eukprot:1148991-Pelagomonas_calceolata.AAC.2
MMISAGQPFNPSILANDLSADLRYRLQGVWREVELVDPRGNNKFATYQDWFATPFACNVRQNYISLHRYLFWICLSKP